MVPSAACVTLVASGTVNPATKAFSTQFDLEGKKRRLAEIEQLTGKANFWEDAARAAAVLKERGARVDYNDPYVPATHKMREYDLKMTSKKLTAAMLKSYDVVLISTNHSDYDYKWIVKHAQLVVDTRNACANVKVGRNKIVKA